MTELATVNVRLSDLDRLEDENAKLRDLIADMSKAFLTLDIDHCQVCPRDKGNRRCQMFVESDGECAFVTEMRRLGIENQCQSRKGAFEVYDEYHEYRVDTQRWTRWPKALIMTHEWSTNGHDRRLEQRRYVPDDYAQEVERKKYSLQGLADLYQQEMRRALDDEHQTRSNVNRLRDRVHEIAADRERIKAENAKLRELVNDMWICVSHGSGWDCTGCRRDPDGVCIMGISEFSQRMRDLGIEVQP